MKNEVKNRKNLGTFCDAKTNFKTGFLENEEVKKEHTSEFFTYYSIFVILMISK